LVVACAAQFIARKGHADLLAAWPEVLAQRPQARLLLLGKGPLEAKLRQQVEQAELTDSVHFGGYRVDLREFVGHATVLAHTAHKEGLGVCLLEAQAAGVPVVAGRAGGIPEAVSEGKSALLVEPHNRAELVTNLLRLLQDAGLRARMGQAGRAYMAKEFSPAAMVSGNLAVYQELLK
jgi:glycosyltransferase involved in cell wall biosynthesis